jgi:hypothetical protein
MSDRGDLSGDIWRRLPDPFKTRSLMAMPCRGCFIVREDGKRRSYDFTEIRLESRTAAASGKAPAPVCEFMPNGSCGRALMAVLLKPLDHFLVGSLGDRG